ncbi:MAG: hypothetical protein ACI9N1_000030 [Flavobacteriales bacterium]|jgi:hypothetical protein
MKTAIKTATLFFALSLITSSCALFRGGGSGGHCPAYGSSINSEETDVEIKNIQEIRENSASM